MLEENENRANATGYAGLRHPTRVAFSYYPTYVCTALPGRCWKVPAQPYHKAGRESDVCWSMNRHPGIARAAAAGGLVACSAVLTALQQIPPSNPPSCWMHLQL